MTKPPRSTMYKFLSTPPAWGATLRRAHAHTRRIISIHAPRMGSDARLQNYSQRKEGISIHAPRMGSDAAGLGFAQTLWKFLSTPPAWGATRLVWGLLRHSGNFYPRPPHGERPLKAAYPTGQADFYPRPPHGERREGLSINNNIKGISIHAPRMGSDAIWSSLRATAKRFLSTPPAWGATLYPSFMASRTSPNFYPRPPHGERRTVRATELWILHFYPRPPHGERLVQRPLTVAHVNFYPRPPHGERHSADAIQHGAKQFLSTPPAWGATPRTAQAKQRKTISIHAPRMGSDQDANHVLAIRNISIHAPRMGSDSSPDPVDLPHSHFYPRPPHGERQLSDEIAQAILKFLSTPPAWGATRLCNVLGQQHRRFLSTPPAWGATVRICTMFLAVRFLSTPPAWGATPPDRCGNPPATHFYPRPPHGERRVQPACLNPRAYFYPRPPHGERRELVAAMKQAYEFLSTPPAWGATSIGTPLSTSAEYFYPRPPHGERQQTWRKKCPVCVCLLCKVRKHPNNSLKSRGLSPKFASPYIKLSKNLCILRCEPPGKIMSDHGSHYSPEESAF